MRKLILSFLLGILMLPALTAPITSAYEIVKPDYLPGADETVEADGNTQDYVLNTTIPRAINIGIGLLGLAAFIGILIAAITLLTAYGNEEKINRAKINLQYSIIGFIVVVFSYAIVSIVVSIALPSEDYGGDTGTNSETSFWIPVAYAADDSEGSELSTLEILFPNEADLIEQHDEEGRVSLPSGDFISEIVPAIITNFFYMIGFLVFIAFMYGGILLITGRGNEESITKAKNIIIYSAVALAFVSLGYAVIFGIATLNLKNDTTTDSDNVFTETNN